MLKSSNGTSPISVNVRDKTNKHHSETNTNFVLCRVCGRMANYSRLAKLGSFSDKPWKIMSLAKMLLQDSCIGWTEAQEKMQ